MPKEIKSVSFQVIWKGQRAAVTVTENNVTVKNMSGKKLSFAVHGKETQVEAGGEASIGY
jgi:trehalose/maltose hydrolase-like predicted phosphorylase